MKTKIKNIQKKEMNNYCHVIITDENNDEYSLNFMSNITDEEIKECWKIYDCWKII